MKQKNALFSQPLHVLVAFKSDNESVRLRDLYKRTGIYYSNITDNINTLIDLKIIKRTNFNYTMTAKGKFYFDRLKGLI